MRLDVHPSMLAMVGNPKVPLLITEGVVKGDAAVSHLGLCTVSVLGVSAFRGRHDQDGLTALADWEHVALNDRDIIVCFDSDVMLKAPVHEALVRMGAFLARRGGIDIHYCYLPVGANGAKVGLDDWIAGRLKADPNVAASALVGELVGFCADRPRTDSSGPIPPAYTVPDRQALSDVDAVFRKWLAQPDLEAVRVALAAVVANRMPGDPVWLLVVAPPSSGKTELLMATLGPPDVLLIGRVTCPALLSGTPTKEQHASATGGLLRQIGERGMLVSKDFGSVLAMKYDARAEVLQAMRDIYDGHYDRPIGADGGRHLIWKGFCGFIAGCTEAIDSHHGVIAQLGDRFVTIRMDLAYDTEPQAQKAITDVNVEPQMRAELADVVGGLLGHLSGSWLKIDDEGRNKLARYPALVVRCRSIVERDGYPQGDRRRAPSRAAGPGGEAASTAVRGSALRRLRRERSLAGHQACCPRLHAPGAMPGPRLSRRPDGTCQNR
jgi:Domain of unknown function (DUF3854)